jgi:hypothetical protein
MEITTPGVYDMPADIYHADPVPGGSLSSSGARGLLPPSCPARYRYAADHPEARETKPAWDLGHAAHLLVLGAGQDLVVVDADDWRTKAAREQRDEAHATGRTPLLLRDFETVQLMAEALREHPMARALFNPDRGTPEQAGFVRDPQTGVWRRALFDWLPDTPLGRGGRMILPDYKTCHAADPEKLARAVYDHGYHQQAAWYLDVAHALGLAGPDAAFVFVCQEKTPPYLVTVVEPDAMALRIGRHLNRQAIDIYAACVASGWWPGYSDDVELVGLPGWVENRYLQEMK